MDLAHSALVAQWAHRRRNVWRRIVALAFEDVGVADIPAVVQVVSLAALHDKSNDQRSLEAALSAATLRSEVPKVRSADHLLPAALKHPEYEWAKTSVCNIAPDERPRAAFAEGLSHLERANATWFGAGLGCGGTDRLTAARANQASLVFTESGVPEELVTSV